MGWCPHKARKYGHGHTEGRPHAGRRRRQPSASPVGHPQKKAIPPAPGSGTSSFQNCGKTDSRCLHHPVSGHLFWQPASLLAPLCFTANADHCYRAHGSCWHRGKADGERGGQYPARFLPHCGCAMADPHWVLPPRNQPASTGVRVVQCISLAPQGAAQGEEEQEMDLGAERRITGPEE